MNLAPLVSIVMPVYEAERYLEQAIESILSQTFRDFEFIIIDDGSRDRTPLILARYQQMDARIHVYQLQNQGMVASLNKGCYLARGKYIARMDADDMSLPDRLRRQVEYMETHAEVGVLGTWVEQVDEDGARLVIWRTPTTSSLIGWFLMFENCISHPSVLMRRDIIARLGFYRGSLAEDYDLWARAISVTRVVNLPEVLLRYRCHEESGSHRHSRSQEQTVLSVMHSMMARLLGREVHAEVTASLRQMVKGSSLDRLQQIERVARLIQQLYRAYLKSNSLTPTEAKEIARDAGGRLYTLAVSASKFSVWKGLLILIEALRLYPQPLSVTTIARGVRSFVRRGWLERSRH